MHPGTLSFLLDKLVYRGMWRADGAVALLWRVTPLALTAASFMPDNARRRFSGLPPIASHTSLGGNVMRAKSGAWGVGFASLVAAVVLAGCGTAHPSAHAGSTASLSPHDAITSATKALLAERDLTITARLQTTPAALIALSTRPEQTPLTATAAKAVSDATITYSVHVASGRTVGQESSSSKWLTQSGDDSAFLLHTGNGADVELRSVGGALFGRADVGRLADLGNASVITRAKLVAAAAGIGVPTPYRAAVAAGLRGEWLHIDAGVARTDVGLLQSVATSLAFGIPSGARLEKELVADIQRSGVASRISAQGDDDHLRISLPLRQLAQAINAAIAASLPDGLTPDPQDPSEVPDQVETADVMTHAGVLSELRIDLAADLIPSLRATLHGEPLALEVIFSPAPVSISAPASATDVDPTPLLKAYVAQVKAADEVLKQWMSTPASNPEDTADLPCPSDLPAEAAKGFCHGGLFVVPSG